MNIKSRNFGTTRDGIPVLAYTLTNNQGASVEILTYGAAIRSIQVPDRQGRLQNVVLGFDNLSDYESHTSFFGCVAGRTAGRIRGASFELEGKTWKLSPNEGPNTLHGGVRGFDKKVWSAAESMGPDHAALSLNYTSPPLEEGYPGELDVNVNYRFDDSNTLTLTYTATTDQETPVVLTNHSYFNLSGDPSADVLSHTLQIASRQFVSIDGASLPQDILNVEGTPFDFRLPKIVGRDIRVDHPQLRNGGGYDHPFLLEPGVSPSILLADPASGRTLAVDTTEEYVVVYSGNQLAAPRTGICLETQYCPDSLHFPLVPARTLKPGQVYRQKTIWRFGVS
ncbi:aldose epimerase family protein [Anaerotalea alkaliphila]|uniref:Aldose 1-epimerase n=1 Tax=Anaerotalea alkaliphila TaxID=2662126 RepID=A0A7X5HXZ9_9FIRM|nr:aldose epimerase family protein [Anaerotalea alkaliphila]NDL68576.1 galactose mutarotase [Anaerotalea alkaliphila]